MITQRTATHVVVTTSGTGHAATWNDRFRRHILACNGRAISGFGTDDRSAVSCKACERALETGRATWTDEEVEA